MDFFRGAMTPILFSVFVLSATLAPIEAHGEDATCPKPKAQTEANDIWKTQCIDNCTKITKNKNPNAIEKFKKNCDVALAYEQKSIFSAEKISNAGDWLKGKLIDCPAIAVKNTAVGAYEFAAALPGLIGHLLRGNLSRGSMVSGNDSATIQKDCAASVACRRALARNTILYNQKNADGTWKISDADVDKAITAHGPNHASQTAFNGRSFNDLMQQAVHDMPIIRDECATELSSLRKDMSADGEEWTTARHQKVYEQLAARSPHCPGALEMLPPVLTSKEYCIEHSDKPWGCLPPAEREETGIRCFGKEFSDGPGGSKEIHLNYCAGVVENLVPVPPLLKGAKMIKAAREAKAAEAALAEVATTTAAQTDTAVTQAALSAEDATFIPESKAAEQLAETPQTVVASEVSSEVVSKQKAIDIENEARFERRKQQAVRDRTISGRGPVRQKYIDENVNTTLTSAAENEEFMKVALKDTPGANTTIYTVENSKMKSLNDTTGDKDLVTSLTNRHNSLVLKKLDELEKANPGLEILRYSDYKSVHFAVKGKVPANIREQIEKALKDAGNEFTSEVAAKSLVRQTDQASSWFKASCGGTGGMANLAIRAARDLGSGLHCAGDSLVDSHISRSLESTHVQRAALEKDLGNTSLFEGKPGSKVPTQKTFDLMRKNSTKESLAAAIRKLPGQSKFTEAQAQALLDYGKKSDEFSPNLYIAERQQVSFKAADKGGMSSDFLGLGSANQAENAKALNLAKNAEQAAIEARKGEQTVTTKFDAKKKAYGDKFKNSMCSGDDCGNIADKVWDDADKQRIINQINADPLTRETRHAFFGAGVKEADRPILALHGESIEKILRKDKTLTAYIPVERMDSMTIGIDMKTAVLNQGRVKAVIGVTGKPLTAQEQALFSEAMGRAVKEFNQKVWREEGIPSGYWGY